MTTKQTTYFHFPADPELREAVKAAAATANMSMSAWLHTIVRKALDDEKQMVPLLEEIWQMTQRLLELNGDPTFIQRFTPDDGH